MKAIIYAGIGSKAGQFYFILTNERELLATGIYLKSKISLIKKIKRSLPGIPIEDK